MNKLIILLILSCTCFYSEGQNLVPNNGFDTFTVCPSSSSQADLTPPWSIVNNNTGTPDYMNACYIGNQGVPSNFYGFQEPVSDSGYYGMITYYDNSEVREYLTVPLNSPLVAGDVYSVGFYVSHSDNFKFASDHFGAHLSIGAISGSGNYLALPFIPQIDNPSGNIISDDENWVLISGLYTAIGGEDHISIGNFYNDANTEISIVNSTSSLGWAYYYVDEAFVIPVSNLQIIGANTICAGDSVTLEAINDTPYTWADSLNPNIILSTDSLLTVAPIETSTYFVYGSNDTVSFTVHVNSYPSANLGNDTTICQGGVLTLDATIQDATYLWQDNSINSSINATQVGTYWVQVTNSCGSAIDSIYLNLDFAPVFDLGNDTTLCQGETLILDATTQNVSYLWQDNSTFSTFDATQTGTYWAQLTNACGSTADSINLNYISLPTIELDNDTTLCQGETLIIDASTENVTYLWQDNSINPTFSVSQQGVYWVEVSNNCGIDGDTINVNIAPLPLLDFEDNIILCGSDMEILQATNVNSTYLWQDNSTDSIYSVSETGNYWVIVDNGYCSATDSVDVIVSDVLVDLGMDIISCDSTLVLDSQILGLEYLWQDGSTEQNLVVENSGNYWVLVQDEYGCTDSDSINVSLNYINVDLGNDLILCDGDNLILDAQNVGANYLWSDLSNSQTIIVNETGTYAVLVYNNECEASDSINVLISSPLAQFAANNTSGCAPLSTLFTDESIQGIAPIISWTWDFDNNQTSNTQNPEVNFDGSGSYEVQLTITDTYGCNAQTSNNIEIEIIPEVNASYSMTPNPGVLGEAIEFMNESTNADSFEWEFGDGNTSTDENPNNIFLNSGEIEIVLISSNAYCSDTATMNLHIYPAMGYYIPNAFTPDGDSHNEYFQVVFFPGFQPLDYSFSIFNRWGEKIFETDNPSIGWNGNFYGGYYVPDGMYVWRVRFKNEHTLEIIDNTGTVTILR